LLLVFRAAEAQLQLLILDMLNLEQTINQDLEKNDSPSSLFSHLRCFDYATDLHLTMIKKSTRKRENLILICWQNKKNSNKM
jgi:hypothetical protein